MSVRKPAVENFKLLQACLDVYTYPVWITDESGEILANNAQATGLMSQITKSTCVDNPNTVHVKGQKWHYEQHELNHGTGCFLNELNEFDEPDRRLKDSINKLEAALQKRTVNKQAVIL